jgi:uncharacterized protein YjbJ (UPF0337 family)
MAETNNPSAIPSKLEAKTDQVIGSAKETVGDAFGNHSLKSEGTTQNAQGHGKETVNNIASFIQGIGHQVEGTIKGVHNALSGKSSNGDPTA